MITVTFIRHGESEDNVKSIWAGWKDAPLSEQGQKQAQAVGEALSATKLDYVYASPLQRACSTGKTIHEAQQPPISFETNPKLREQHFGIAEGKPWTFERPQNRTLQELYDDNIFPVLYARHEAFPGGESLDDLARRAEEAVAECVLPHVHEHSTHIAIASHGLCISEMIAALLRLDPDSRRDVSYTGLLNTAWTRVNISVKNGATGPIDPSFPPVLSIHITDVNNHQHLSSINTISEPNMNQSEARAYFGGKSRPRAASNTNAEIITNDKN